MLIDWVRLGQTLGRDTQTSLRSIHMSWPWAKYFPVRPAHSVNKYIFLTMLTGQGWYCVQNSEHLTFLKVTIYKKYIIVKTIMYFL